MKFSRESSGIACVYLKIGDRIITSKKKFYYDELRGAVTAVWEQISFEFLIELLDSMQARCDKVTRANGMHTS